MINLLICEAKKFKKTYINLLAFFGMVSPVILMAIAFTVAKSDFLAKDAYNWYEFSQRVVEMFVFLVGPLITSFIAVSSVFYEYQCKTMKNVLITPYSRTQVIISKILYVSIQIIILYAFVALMNILCAFMLGFNITAKETLQYSGYFLLAGLTTTIVIPISMLFTLLFRNFIPAMIISVAGIIPNISAYYWDKCYLSPWAVPEVLVLVKAEFLKMNIVYPIIALIAYFIIFMVLIIVYFKSSDQNC